MKLSDYNNNNYGRVAPCKALYVYLDGCDYAYRVYTDGDVTDTSFGTKIAFHDDKYTIGVAQYGTPNQLYWKYYNYKYWLYLYNSYTLQGIKKTSSASWFHITPYYPLRVSKVYSGVRYYYNFYADINYCGDEFTFRLDYSGKQVYVEKCIN